MLWSDKMTDLHFVPCSPSVGLAKETGLQIKASKTTVKDGGIILLMLCVCFVVGGPETFMEIDGIRSC